MIWDILRMKVVSTPKEYTRRSCCISRSQLWSFSELLPQQGWACPGWHNPQGQRWENWFKVNEHKHRSIIISFVPISSLAGNSLRLPKLCCGKHVTHWSLKISQRFCDTAELKLNYNPSLLAIRPFWKRTGCTEAPSASSWWQFQIIFFKFHSVLQSTILTWLPLVHSAPCLSCDVLQHWQLKASGWWPDAGW